MSTNPKSRRLRMVLALAVPTVAVALLLSLRGSPAQAQVQALGPMSAPACQCSPAVTIPGMGQRISQCICGVMACAVTEPLEATRGSTLMQCVRQ